jgi:predicted metal-dependent hydrolase
MNENFSYSSFTYRVKFQARKSLMLYVLVDGSVEVRAPHGMNQKHIVSFVEKKSRWIVKTREQQLQRKQWKAEIEPGASVWFLGTARRLEVKSGNDVEVLCSEDSIALSVRDPWNLPRLSRQLNDWYRDQAQQVFGERLLLVCQRFPGILAAPELRLRSMRRRWGSCSGAGRVTLNVELVKLPLTLIDYVIAHELCHLFEFNHGKNFYALLEHVMPDWKQREQALKQF